MRDLGNRVGADCVSGLPAAVRRKHLHFIESIAEKLRQPVQEIMPLCDEVLEALSTRAWIGDYLPIFVTKRVKRILSGQCALARPSAARHVLDTMLAFP